MCQYIETFHEYNRCRLRETYPNDKPSRFAWFLGIVGRGPAYDGDGDGEDEGTDADAEQPQEPPECHKITQKHIYQCEDATLDPAQQDKPIGERVCSDPLPDASEEQQAIDEIGYTKHPGDCPVCLAVEEVIKEKTNTTVIVSKSRSRSLFVGCINIEQRAIKVAQGQRQPSPDRPRNRERRVSGPTQLCVALADVQ